MPYPEPTQLPFVSVIMPLRNEGAFVERSLGSVLGQDYPHSRMEVLVADGMSTDGSRAAIGHMREQTWIPITLIDNPGRIVSTGFNRAVARAHGSIIIRADGHTILAPDYVSQCVAALQRSGAENVGGRMDAVAETPVGQAVVLATSSPFGIGGGRFHYSECEEWVDTVYMGAWPRAVFEDYGLFDEELVRNQDDEFNYRLRSGGGKILLSPAIRSSYYSRKTLRAVGSQYFQYGLWKVRVMQKHLRQMQARQFVPPMFAAALSVFCAGALWSGLFAAGLLALLALYLLAALAASLATIRRGGMRSLLVLPLVFATLHLSYGFGFLLGLARFCNRWQRPAAAPEPAINEMRRATRS